MHFIMTHYKRTSPRKPRSRLFFIQLPFISQNMLSQNLYCVCWRHKSLQVDYQRNESRLWAYNEQKHSWKFPLCCVYTFCCCHKVHSRSWCLIIWHLSICFSFADRTKTLRTKQQKQRKSLRKYARSLRSLEESCPTECYSLMWESRVKHKNTLSNWYIWSFRS